VDEDRMRRVLRNLVRNAIEALPDGGLLQVETGRDGAGAWIAVSDNGGGIPEQVAERLFEPFVTAGKVGGSGLGLAIVRKTVLDHGGSVEAGKSEWGGARFTVRLPLAGATAA
jgi:signal transduction histidine kinase